ncbi:PREDICTED: anosmin-1 [Polistes canadensis]|uniref:anosmin-1 n=1 Tax=Polistes canadensis TaxID=91411 RepID=UPI000718CD20|nr:PREDICTED: anosmin-1 [Polistes canadensis]
MIPLGRPTSKPNSTGSNSIEGTTTGCWRPPPTTTTLKKWWPWWLLLPGCFASWTKYVEEYDSIRVARCDARCGDNHPDECMENCLASNYTKPGYCPESAFMSPFEAVCLIACDSDSRCPDLTKCCSHDCGVTCMHPVGLDNITDLPPIPQNLQIRQQKSNLIHLTWRNIGQVYPNLSVNSDVRYLIEERHLLGPRYLESRLSSWIVRHVSTKPHATLRGRLKTGHWYQFRVAAINGNGSKGYSQPSRPFKTKEPRNPKEPQNLTLSGARLIGGKLRINLRWVKPTSDVPITFYKVFWSRRINSPTNDSVLVFHRTVRKIEADIGRRSRRCERYQGGLHVRKMICHCGDVKVRLVWPMNQDAKMYNVSWKEESCSSIYDDTIETKKRLLWKVIQTPHYDLRHLKQDCTYTVNVRNLYNNDKIDEHGTSIEFFATGCQQDRDEKRWKYSSNKGAQCKKKSSKSKKYTSTDDNDDSD